MKTSSPMPAHAGPAALAEHRGDNIAIAPPQLRVVRLATAAWCAALVAIVIAIHAHHEALPAGTANSPWLFLHRQDKVLGLAAIALGLLTLPFGLFYGRGLAARARLAPQARAIHITISLSALATIVLHVAALWSASALSWYNANALLVPFGYPDDARFPHPIAAGVIGFWLIVLFGPTYFLRKRLGGIARWRIAHRLVLVGLALAALHSLYLSGPIPGYMP